jgi:type IV pilus assembly protein PilV
MKGFTLLEVLISLFILSYGLLSMAGMQLSALQHSQDAYLRSVATVQLNSMLERLRANSSAVVRDRELLRWNESNLRVLPRGKGEYQCKGENCTATIFWRGKQEQTLSLSY